MRIQHVFHDIVSQNAILPLYLKLSKGSFFAICLHSPSKMALFFISFSFNLRPGVYGAQ